MSDDFELGGEDDGAYVKRDLFNVITSRMRIAEQASICVYKSI